MQHSESIALPERNDLFSLFENPMELFDRKSGDFVPEPHGTEPNSIQFARELFSGTKLEHFWECYMWITPGSPGISGGRIGERIGSALKRSRGQ